jgi:hypothetical protein
MLKDQLEVVARGRCTNERQAGPMLMMIDQSFKLDSPSDGIDGIV